MYSYVWIYTSMFSFQFHMHLDTLLLPLMCDRSRGKRLGSGRALASLQQ